MTEPCYAQARVRTLLIDSMVCVERPQLMLRRARCSPENEVRGHLESNGKSADLRRHLVHVATTHLLGYSQWHIHWMVAFGSTIPDQFEEDRRPTSVRSISTSLATLRIKMLGSFKPHFT